LGSAKKSSFAVQPERAQISRSSGSLQPPGFRPREKTLRPSAALVPIRDKERVVSDRSVSISPPSFVASKGVVSPAAARTRLLLEGPILPTLLRLAAPNVLTLLAFAGVITFDGFFLGRIGTNASLVLRWHFPG
jgi:hypothetical protein